MAVGVSLGGILLSNYLSQEGEKARNKLVAAMVISVCFDCFKGTESLEKYGMNRMLNRHLASCLVDSIKEVLHKIFTFWYFDKSLKLVIPTLGPAPFWFECTLQLGKGVLQWNHPGIWLHLHRTPLWILRCQGVLHQCNYRRKDSQNSGSLFSFERRGRSLPSMKTAMWFWPYLTKTILPYFSLGIACHMRK